MAKNGKNGKNGNKQWITEANEMITKPEEERTTLLNRMKVGKPKKAEFIEGFIIEAMKTEVKKADIKTGEEKGETEVQEEIPKISVEETACGIFSGVSETPVVVLIDSQPVNDTKVMIQEPKPIPKKYLIKQREVLKKLGLKDEEEEIPKPAIILQRDASLPRKPLVQVLDKPVESKDEQENNEAPKVPEVKKEKKENKKTQGGKKEMIKNITSIGTGVEKYDFTRMLTSGPERLQLKNTNLENELYRMDTKLKAKDDEGNVLRFPVVIEANYFAGDEIKLIPANRKIPAYDYIPVYLVEKGKSPRMHIHLRDGVHVSPDGKIRGMAELCFLAIGGTNLKIQYLNVFPFEDGEKEIYSVEIGISKPRDGEGSVHVGPSVNTYHTSFQKGQKPQKIMVQGYISLYPI